MHQGLILRLIVENAGSQILVIKPSSNCSVIEKVTIFKLNASAKGIKVVISFYGI